MWTKMEARKAELKKQTAMDMAKAEISKAASDDLNEGLSYNHLRFDSIPASHDPGPWIENTWLIKHISPRHKSLTLSCFVIDQSWTLGETAQT